MRARFLIAGVALLASVVSVEAASPNAASKIASPIGIENNASWAPNWSGFYVGVNGGGQVATHDLALDNTTTGASVAGLEGISGRGWIYGVHGGAGWRLKGTPFYLGLDASYQFGEAETTASVWGVGVLNATVEPKWKVGPRVGYIFTNSTMLYVGYQYAVGELNISLPGGSKSWDLRGGNALVGVEFPVTSNIKFALQGDWTRYRTETLWSADICVALCGYNPNNDVYNNFRLNDDIDVYSVTGRLSITLPGL